jgi:hypothetical protein
MKALQHRPAHEKTILGAVDYQLEKISSILLCRVGARLDIPLELLPSSEEHDRVLAVLSELKGDTFLIGQTRAVAEIAANLFDLLAHVHWGLLTPNLSERSKEFRVARSLLPACGNTDAELPTAVSDDFEGSDYDMAIRNAHVCLYFARHQLYDLLFAVEISSSGERIMSIYRQVYKFIHRAGEELL